MSTGPDQHPAPAGSGAPRAGAGDPLPVSPIRPARGRAAFSVRIRPPGSKSLTNRALLLGALVGGRSFIRHPLVGADDAERMIGALSLLGARIERAPGGDLVVDGVGGQWNVPPEGVTLDLGNAGTATRFLAAAALLGPPGRSITIDGNARMRQRPIGELIATLEPLGLRVDYSLAPGCPPVRLTPGMGPAPAGGRTGSRIEFATTHSSQFISAVLLVAPWLPGGVTVTLKGAVTSAPYIAMTLGLLDALGASVKSSDDLRVLRVAPPRPAPGAPAGLAPFDYTVEPDASGATYFWGAAALFPGAVCRVAGLDDRSLQGDARFPEVLSRMGVTVVREADGAKSIGCRGPASIAPVMADMSPMPDAAMTLAAVACFAGGRSVIRGLRTLRVKESDRINAMQTELARIGVRVETDILGDRDTITITPPPAGVDCSDTAPRVEFETYDDHRMAMSLALIGLRRPNVFIKNPGCVAKTYPSFWQDLARLYEG